MCVFVCICATTISHLTTQFYKCSYRDCQFPNMTMIKANILYIYTKIYDSAVVFANDMIQSIFVIIHLFKGAFQDLQGHLTSNTMYKTTKAASARINFYNNVINNIFV